MEINRNQYFMAGLVLLFLGIQFRMVDSFILNEKSSKFMVQRFGTKAEKVKASLPFLNAAPLPMSRHVLRPPEWLSWALISIGAVLTLHSLALPRPG